MLLIYALSQGKDGMPENIHGLHENMEHKSVSMP